SIQRRPIPRGEQLHRLGVRQGLPGGLVHSGRDHLARASVARYPGQGETSLCVWDSAHQPPAIGRVGADALAGRWPNVAAVGTCDKLVAAKLSAAREENVLTVRGIVENDAPLHPEEEQ